MTASGEVVAEIALGPMEVVTALAAWPTLTTPFARPSTTFCALSRPHNQFCPWQCVSVLVAAATCPPRNIPTCTDWGAAVVTPVAKAQARHA